MSKILTFSEVRSWHEAREFAKAKEGYLKLLKKDAKNIDALHFLAILCAQQGDIATGISYLEKAIRYQPNNPVLHLHLANLYKTEGSLNKAADILQQLRQTHPDYIPTLNNLGSVYYALEKYPEAEHHYRLAIEKQPQYTDAYYNLGLTLAKQQNYSEAIDAFRIVIQQAPEHAAARFQLGCLLMQQQKIDEAIQCFQTIEEHHPFHLETQSNLATCYLKKGAFEEAKKSYLQALALAPNDTQILFNLGVICQQQGLIDQAIQYYQRTLQTDATLFDAHNNIGVAFLAKQHVGFALHHFKQALRLQPNNIAIQYTVKMLEQDERLLFSPPDYITNLFDAYADHYEIHLQQALDYQVPELLLQAMYQCIKPALNTLDILDLGCGTGLCGILFKPLSHQLIGVDLSKKMLAIAQQKNIYDQLIVNNIETFLTENTQKFDLILAGDVLVYIGDLENLYTQIHRTLKPNGLFIFNTEISAKEDFTLNQSGRFAHQRSYLENLAKKHGFEIIYCKEAMTRKQNDAPVMGHINIIRAATVKERF